MLTIQSNFRWEVLGCHLFRRCDTVQVRIVDNNDLDFCHVDHRGESMTSVNDLCPLTSVFLVNVNVNDRGIWRSSLACDLFKEEGCEGWQSWSSTSAFEHALQRDLRRAGDLFFKT